MKRFAAALLIISVIVLSFSILYPQPVASQEKSEEPFDWKSDWTLPEGFAIEIDTEGYEFPSAIAFVPNPGADPKDPLYFVTELRGKVTVVTNDRSKYTFAQDFAPKFKPKEELPSGYGQGGLAGICLDPKHGYVFVTYIYQDANQILRHNITRFQSEPDTFSLEPAGQLDFTDIFLPYEAGLAHHIGPCQVKDETLYVSVGEAWQPRLTQQLDAMNGKIIRMTLDGKPLPDNPYYQDDDISQAANYVWAYGLRNPFSLKFVGERLFVADNGPSVDRFLEIFKGKNYLYDGTDASIATNAHYVIVPSLGPVQMDYYPERSTLFPEPYQNLFYVALAGSVEQGKLPGVMTFEFGMAENELLNIPKRFVGYRSKEPQIVAGLAFGPDGLYFSPLYPNKEGRSFILKVRYDPEHSSAYTLLQSSDPDQLMRDKGCAGCHTRNDRGGYGGAAGPDLTRDPMVERLQTRLDTQAYVDSLKEIDKLETEPHRSYKAAREEVAAAEGLDRVRVWLKYRIMEPRFDNLYSQMPNLGLSEQEAGLIADYLLAGKEKKSRLERVLGRVLPEELNYNHILYFALGGFVLGGVTLAVVQFTVSRFRRKSTAVTKSSAEPGQVAEAPR
jgi:hypothetical protein